jgi:hypothetical protein
VLLETSHLSIAPPDDITLVLQVAIEEGQDPAPRVAGRRFVVAGAGAKRQRAKEHVGVVVVIKEGVPGLGVLDHIVIDAERAEGSLEPSSSAPGKVRSLAP